MLPWLVFYDPADGRGQPNLAGQLTVSGIVGGSASWGQIGYWVDERLAGRGIIPTAVALAVDYCFGAMGLHRIEIAIRPENERSLRVVAKLGFRPEGLRPRYLHIDGDWRDHLVFALNAEEVPEGSAAALGEPAPLRRSVGLSHPSHLFLDTPLKITSTRPARHIRSGVWERQV